MNNLLEVKDITVKFGEKTILNNISFGIKKGDIVSLIGKNGTGKSTLLKTIVGSNKEYSGDIIKNYSQIGYVPQKLDFDTTVPLTVKEFLHIYNGKLNNKGIILLEQFDCSELIYKKISQLSGGELQKILIINSLISNPEFLILDEPTSGVDIIGEESFYKIINDIRLSYPDLSILIVSHNMKMVYSQSNKIICLHRNCYCTGTPDEIKNNEQFGEIFGDFVIPYNHTHSHNHKH